MSRDANCDCCKGATSCAQSLSEMDWERGIWNAALYNDGARVQQLLSKGTDPGVLDDAGYSALHYAARAGNIYICEILLDEGAPVDARTRAGEATALHRAASAGKIKVVELLLDAGASVTVQDSDGQTPLHRAAEKCHEDIVEAILTKSTEVKKILDNRGRNPLMCIPSHADRALFDALS